MSTPPPSPADRAGPELSAGLRILLAFFFGIAALVYTYRVTTGEVAQPNRIDLAHLGFLVATALLVAILVRPAAFTRVKLLEMGGFKLEMLERVKAQQAKQADQLASIALMLPLLLPETERKHLTSLDRGTTQNYKGGSSVRAELRRLRSIGLVKMKEGRSVGELTSDKSFDLSEHLELTPLGKAWVGRIEAIEKLDTAGTLINPGEA